MACNYTDVAFVSERFQKEKKKQRKQQQETCDSATFQSKQSFSVNSQTKSDLTRYQHLRNQSLRSFNSAVATFLLDKSPEPSN